MALRMISTAVQRDGKLKLPKSVRQALHLSGRGGLVGFIIDGKRVVLTKATVVPTATLSDEELAALAHLSKRRSGRRTFQSAEAALRHLWSL